MANRISPVVRVVVVIVLVAAIAGWAVHAATGQARAGSQKVTLTLWYWNRSIDDRLIAEAPKVFPNIHLVAEKIGGNYNAKLRTTLAGQTEVPDIVGLNSDISTFFPDESQFINLLDIGAGAVKNEYLTWKWDAGIAPDGRMIGFPMDTGPTALFYRADMFKKAGLPTNPKQLATQFAMWDAYFQAGKKLRAALPGTYLLDSLYYSVFLQVMAQSPQQYMNPAGTFIGNQGAARRAWNLAISAHNLGVSAKSQAFTTDWDAAADNGKFASFVGAVWMKDILTQAAPDTAGKWRVAPAPGGAGNNGGSFLAVTTYSQHPREAFDVIRWLESPANQLAAYTDIDLFPSTPSDYSNPRMNRPETYFGGQNTNAIFSAAARQVKPAYFSPNYDTINTYFQEQVIDVDTQNANPAKARATAIQQSQRALSH